MQKHLEVGRSVAGKRDGRKSSVARAGACGERVVLGELRKVQQLEHVGHRGPC